MVDTVETGAGAAERLRITEIFLSLQGEAASVGWPTVFVRLTGCPLRCGYCDTAYAFHGGQWMSLDEILGAIAGFGVKHVCVTGGEPLAQRRCLELLRRLCNAGYLVSLETSGALDTSGVDPRVTQVLDIKTPGSGEVDRNLRIEVVGEEGLQRDDLVEVRLQRRGRHAAEHAEQRGRIALPCPGGGGQRHDGPVP